MSTNKRVLLLDWGIGGLSVYNEMKRSRPDLEYLYVSDSGFTPYGKVAADDLAARVSSITRVAKMKNPIQHTVIACNAASTVQAQVRKNLDDENISGVIEAGVSLIRECGKSQIGVIGGLRTIEAKVFSKACAGMGLDIREQVAQPLSALIEAGILTGPTLQKELTEILAPLAASQALLLACTHYPAISSEIQKILPLALLLDPAARTAQDLEAALPRSSASPGEDLFFTTGSINTTEKSARAAFGLQNSFSRWEMPSGL
ncbi:MAG: aspartate/glutamate racemase family protein [Bdellovibrionota bacterium]